MAASKLDFGALVDATNTARRDNPVVVVVGGKEYALTGVEVTVTDLDEGKSARDVANGDVALEGHSHVGAMVRLTAG